jgi:hypothetical protein
MGMRPRADCPALGTAMSIITPHIRPGLEEAGGKILKVNTMPGFHYYSKKFAQIKPAVLRTFLTRYEL